MYEEKVSLKKLTDDLQKLSKELEQTLNNAQYEEYEEVAYRQWEDSLDYDKEDTEDTFLIKQYKTILKQLSDVAKEIVYLQLPITEEGTLDREARYGSYCIKGDRFPISYMDGDDIEFWAYNQRSGREEWCKSVVVCNGEYSYIKGYECLRMEGLRVRKRRWVSDNE